MLAPGLPSCIVCENLKMSLELTAARTRELLTEIERMGAESGLHVRVFGQVCLHDEILLNQPRHKDAHYV
eukprot:4122119-Pyramimonas_sp.AAC.1